MNLPRVVFVTGLSGAGQSQAIKSFEDLGFYCVEHLPAVVLAQTVDALARARIEEIAIALDVRGADALGDPCAAIDGMVHTHNARLLFLDAHDDALVRRFSQTRRLHPLRRTGSLIEAIEADRRLMAPLRERATLVVDTSSLTHAALKQRIAAAFLPGHQARLGVTLVSFGFKYGLPTDLDLLFDVRFLKNPNYEAALAPLTGEEPAVAAFIESDPALEPFMNKTSELIDFLLPRYLAEGKTQLTIGFGCTGGRHRSVYTARRMFDRLARDARLEVALEARDVRR